MNNKFITFLEIHEENILIISSILFVLLTIIFTALITSLRLHTYILSKFMISVNIYSVILLLFFFILNINFILFLLFVIYTTTSSNSSMVGNNDYWLFTSSLILTCLIVYNLTLLTIFKFIGQNIYSHYSQEEFENMEGVLIPVLILIKLIVGLSAISLYLYNYVENGGTFDFKTVFISIISLLIIIAMNKLFRVAFKMDSGTLSKNKFVYGLLGLLLLLIVYLIVLDIINNKKKLSSSYYIVAIALLLTFILALFIFFILSFLKKNEHDDDDDPFSEYPDFIFNEEKDPQLWQGEVGKINAKIKGIPIEDLHLEVVAKKHKVLY